MGTSPETKTQAAEAELAVEHAVASKPWKPYLEASLGFRNHWYPAMFGAELKEGEVKG